MTPQSPGDVFVADTISREPKILWDKVTAAAGTTLGTQLAYFTHTQAANGSHVTNLQKANTLPPPEAYSLMAIGWRFSPVMLLADIVQFINNYEFEMKIGRKVIVEGLIDHYSAGVGLSGFASTNSGTAALIEVINNGHPGIDAQRRFNDYPRTLPAEVMFSLLVTLGQGGTAPALVATVASTAVSPAYGGYDVRSDLDGVYEVGVQ